MSTSNQVHAHRFELEAKLFDQSMLIGPDEDPDLFLDRFATLVSECKAAKSTLTSPDYVKRLARCCARRFDHLFHYWDEKAYQQMGKPAEEHDDIYDVIDAFRRFHHRQKELLPSPLPQDSSASSQSSMTLVKHARRDTDRASASADGDTCPIHKGASHSLQKCRTSQSLIREYLKARENGEDELIFEIRGGNKKKSKE
jgi:hypothetical protein